MLIAIKKILNKIKLILLAFSFLFTSSCNKKESFSATNLFDKTILKVVEVKSSTDNIAFGYATGFYISSNGYILTNKHVIYNETYNLKYDYVYIRVANYDKYTKAEVIDISSNYDLAILKVNQSNCMYFTTSQDFKAGEEIFTIGNPLNIGLSFSQGYISSPYRKINDTYVLQTSLVISEGNSGGPVFNKDGKLLGIISFRLKDNTQANSSISFAVPSIYIDEYISQFIQ